MIIYDVDIPIKTAQKAVAWHFRKNAHVKDSRFFLQAKTICLRLKICTLSNRVIDLLLSKGYMELEESLKQWKQKTHLLRILEVWFDNGFYSLVLWF